MADNGNSTVTLNQFIGMVDALLLKHVGISTADLTDFNISDYFEPGMESDDPYLQGDIRDAAIHGLQVSGAPDELLDIMYES
jgi:hypothetical protein